MNSLQSPLCRGQVLLRSDPLAQEKGAAGIGRTALIDATHK
jgi:hypothetical protein